ncbi:MAG: hypothetical protein WCW31_02475 [Patescibacteria group bacterium]
MQKAAFDASQLIAMIDYPPLHSPEALLSYYEKHKSGAAVEPVIVVPIEAAIGYFAERSGRYETYKEALNEFLPSHPSARYFMLGGKHRSAAATILGVKIPCLVVGSDADVAEIRSLMSEGKITGVPSVGKDFIDTLRELEEHYYEHKKFWTMEEKTKAMIKNKDIPEGMLKTKLK